MPELTPIDQWSQTNNITDPIEKVTKYGDYVREEYFKEDAYDNDVETAVQQNVFGELDMLGQSDPNLGLNPEKINELMAPRESSFDKQFELVLNNYGSTDEGYDDLVRFNTAKKGLQQGRIRDTVMTPEDRERYETMLPELENRAKSVVGSKFEETQRRLLADGVLPMAKIRNAKGEADIVGGAAADSMTPFQAYQQGSRLGIFTPDDIGRIKNAYQKPEGYDVPLYKLKNYDATTSGAFTLYNKDKDFKAWADGLAESMGKVDKGEGQFYLEQDSRSKKMDLMLRSMDEKFPELASLPTEDKQAAVNLLTGNIAAQSGFLKFQTDDPSKNIHYFGYNTPVLHRDAIARKDIFDQVLAANPNLTEQQKESFTTERLKSLQASFDQYNQVFNDTYLADDWNTFLQRGFAQGKKEYEILDEFMMQTDYSAFRNKIGALGGSIPDAAIDVVAGVGAMLGSEAGRNELLENQRVRDARRRLANMFGDEFGVAMTVGEMAAPVIFDVVTTAALTTTTGVGGALYTGAKLSARGVLTGIARGALARGARETTEQAAQRIAATGLVKGATKELAQEGAKKAIIGYAQATANKYAIRSAVAVPAFTRSASMTYANVYSVLDADTSEEGKKMTAEEKHDRALAAGLIAGTVTAGITLGFSALGRGGLEDFIVGGATPRQMKAVLQRLRGQTFEGAGGVSDEAFNKVVANTVSKGLKSMWKTSAAAGVVKDFTDEALEEGLDEFVNSFIETGFTDEDRPMIDRLTQSGMAAFYGGVFGGTVGAFRATAGRVARGRELDEEVCGPRKSAWQNRYPTDFVNPEVRSLRKWCMSGSSVCANARPDPQLLNQLRNQNRNQNRNQSRCFQQFDRPKFRKSFPRLPPRQLPRRP
jgi:hypothetical protein